jgi:hypothetical protein
MSTKSYSMRVVKYLSLLVLGLSLVGSAFVFASKSGSGSNQIANLNGSEKTHADSEHRRSLIESEVITATRRGFEPAAISRPQGRFILMIDNRSGTDLNFRFSRETGESIHEIGSSREQLDWNEIVDLQPGRYVLTERDHPDWTCSIRITAR